ncbi:MAG: CPBP family intramembrane metalloprotease [Alistipes sp.]|nr:CPBP family intramembrane metalloprotease [Alistipes sp.]
MEEKKLLGSAPFPSAGDLLVMLGLFFVIQLGCSLLGIAVLLFAGKSLNTLQPNELGAYLAATSFASMLLVSILLVGYRRWRCAPSISWGLRPRRFDPRLLLWGYLLMAAIGLLLEPLYLLLPELDQQVGRGLGSIVALVIIAPLFEEFICRGLIYGSLRTRYRMLPSMLLSALFFGVLHLHPTALINAFFMGLILAYIYERTATLWSAIALHALNNATAYLLLISGLSEESLRTLIGNDRLYAILWIAALLFAFFALFRLRQLAKSSTPEGKNRATT